MEIGGAGIRELILLLQYSVDKNNRRGHFQLFHRHTDPR